MLDPYQVAAPAEIEALCQQVAFRVELLRCRVRAPSIPRRSVAVAAHDLEGIVRPLQNIIELLHKAQLRPPTRETNT